MLAAKSGSFDTILWIIAVVLVIAGIVAIPKKAVLWGIVLIIAGVPRGTAWVSIFK